MDGPEAVILFVVDGMRPDAMLQARTPAMRALMARGASTLAACTVMPSITLPTHMSMIHGVPPEVHGVASNLWQPASDEALPGIFEAVHAAKRSAAAFYTWEELRDLWRPGMLAYSSFVNIYGPHGEESDAIIARLAADYLVEQRTDFAFIYLGLVDEIGHQHGWLSPEYQRGIEGADAVIAHVLGRLEAAGQLDKTAILLTADHGGHGHGHGMDIPEDMFVPWVLAGPGIRSGVELSTPVRIYDTAPTIAALLGIEPPAAWQGLPVTEAFERILPARP